MKIGVFDSGIGGEAVARDLRVAFPDAEIMTVSDRKNLPYGLKTSVQIKQFVDDALQPLLKKPCDVIVIACNTATTIALPTLRDRYPEQKFIGIEPMIKPAATMTRSGIICICATPATLASIRYNELKTNYASAITIIEPDCSDWAMMIEDNTINEERIRSQINEAISHGADVIVLGCTHYHWIKELIESIAGEQADVIEPTGSIVARIKQLAR
ncbi:MAG: aspartate/glutamate racemase family protein [Candidatus Saccharimonadales bacterium]